MNTDYDQRRRKRTTMALVVVGVLAALLLLGATLLMAFGWPSWLSFRSSPRPCAECRIPGPVFGAISRDPALRSLPGTTSNRVRGGTRCGGDSGTETGVSSTFKRGDGNTRALVRDLSDRAKRLGWSEQERPLALAWFGEKQVAGASVRLYLAVLRPGVVEAGISAYCTAK